jgi:hypothetical protein
VHKLIIAGIGVLAVALLATGCGGGGSDEATAQVSKAEFYKQVRAICAKRQKKLHAVVEASSGDVSAAYNHAAPAIQREAEELDAISGPEAVEEKFKPFIAHILKVSQLIAREGQAAANAPSFRAYEKEAFALHLFRC